MELTMHVNNLSCGYAKRTVLSEVSFTLRPGEIICLLGPNGAGKSTLFKTLLGFLPRHGGEILIGQRDVKGFSRRELAKVMAYVPQAHVPPFPYSVEDVVLMGRSSHLGRGGHPRQTDYDRVRHILDSLGMTHLSSRTYTAISGGERQMVLIARALAQEPRFLVMDEPTSSLDYDNQQKVLRKVLDSQRQHIGIIMASHNPDHAFFCDADVLLLSSEGTVTHGHCRQVLTEETLSSAFQTSIKLLTETRGGKDYTSCVLEPPDRPKETCR